MSDSAQMWGIDLCHSCDVQVQSVHVRTREDVVNHPDRVMACNLLWPLCRNSYFTRREVTSCEKSIAQRASSVSRPDLSCSKLSIVFVCAHWPTLYIFLYSYGMTNALSVNTVANLSSHFSPNGLQLSFLVLLPMDMDNYIHYQGSNYLDLPQLLLWPCQQCSLSVWMKSDALSISYKCVCLSPGYWRNNLTFLQLVQNTSWLLLNYTIWTCYSNPCCHSLVASERCV